MRILVTGASGQLGAYLLRRLRDDRDFDVVAWSGTARGELFGMPLRAVNLTRPDEIATAFRDARPEVVLHAAAIGRVDACHADPGLAERVNHLTTRQLARLVGECRARLVYVSTDLVFDGSQGNYDEQDAAVPLSCYGRSKLAGEASVLELPSAAAVRLSLLFGPSLIGKPSFFDQQCAALSEGRALTLFADEFRTPLSLLVAANALLELAASDVTGLVHIGGPQRMSRWEMGRLLAGSLGRDPSSLRAVSLLDATFPEPRPHDVSLDSSRWRRLFPAHPWPMWEKAVRDLLAAGSQL